MYKPKSKRLVTTGSVQKKKELNGLMANKNIDDIRALADISNAQSSLIKQSQTNISTKQDKITLTTTGSSGASTFTDNVLNIPQYLGMGSVAGGDLSGTYPNPSVIKLLGNTIPTNALGYLKNDGSGVLTWATISTGITVNTTPITVGTSGRLLFDNAGTVGETSGINWNSSTATLSLLDSPFYSQAGNSSTNTAFSITGTASSDYTIYSSRQFIFNTGQSMYFNTDTDGGSALDRAWYFAGARTGITGGRTYGALTVDSSGFPSFTLYNNDNGARILLASNATSYFNGGNLLVGTTTDAGYKLDVNGTIASKGRFTIFGEQEIRQDGTASYITSRLGIFRFKGWSADNLTAEFNGWNQQSYLNSPLNIGSSSLTMASMLSVYGIRTASSAIARGVYFNNTLVAAANNDVLVGLDIAPTYTNGAFTGVQNIALRVNYVSGRQISFSQRPGYADYGRIAFSNVTGADIASSGNISLIPGDANEIISFGSFLTRSAFTASSNYGTYSPTGVGLQVSSNRPFVFRNISTDTNTDFFVFEAPNTGARRLFNIIQNSVSYLTVFPTGNVTIGTTTDAGYKLDVNGTARFSGQTFIQSAAGVVGLIADFGQTNSRIQFESHGSNDFTQIKIGNNFSLSRNGGSNPSITTTSTFDFKVPRIDFSSSSNVPSKIFISGNYGLGSAYFGASNSNGTTASTLYFQNSITPLAVQNVIATFNLWGMSDNAAIPTIPASSMFSLESTTRGFLPPRMSNTQMLAIATPSEGLVVYDLTNRKLCCYDGATWQNLF